MWGGWALKPKFLGQHLPKIKVFSDVYPNFSFRRLPWAAIASYIVGIQTTMYVGGWEGSQSPRSNIYLKLKFPSRIIPILAPARFRGAQWDTISEFNGRFRRKWGDYEIEAARRTTIWSPGGSAPQPPHTHTHTPAHPHIESEKARIAVRAIFLLVVTFGSVRDSTRNNSRAG